MDDRAKIASRMMAARFWINSPIGREKQARQAVADADALIAALRETPDPNATLDAFTAEAQEAGDYDEVGDWRQYAKKTDDLYIRRVASGCYSGSDVDRAFAWACTPQGHDFWVRVALATATPAEEARACNFARRVLEAMEKKDD